MKRFHLLIGLALFVLNASLAQSFEFAHGMGNANFDEGRSVAVDSRNGDIVITGFHTGTVDFDPTAGTSNRTSFGGTGDMFVAKYDSDGAIQWATDFNGDQNDFPMDVAVDGSGNIYVAGAFNGTVDFDPGIGTASRTSRGWTDAFLLKLNENGTFQWVVTFGGVNTNNAQDGADAIALDAAGNVYLVGSFEGSFININPLGSVSFQSAINDQNIFLIKYNSNGIRQWSKNMGSTTLDDRARDVAIGPNGNVFITGYFAGSCDFNPSVAGGTLSSFGAEDGFVASYTSLGTYRWARRLGGVNNDDSWGIAVANDGNVGICGKFMISANIGGNNLTSTGSEDCYVASYTNNGTNNWALKMGGTSNDLATRMAADGCGHFYVAGFFEGTADFDPGAGTYNLIGPVSGFPGPQRSAYFLARYNADGTFGWAGTSNANAGRTRPWGLALDGCEDLYMIGGFNATQDFNITAGTATRTHTGGGDIFLSKHSLPHTTVTNTTSTGPGSYTYAINCANARAGRDTIRFCIPGAGTQTITSDNPTITDDTTIVNATTQPGYTLGMIRLDGASLTGTRRGIVFSNADHGEVIGMSVVNFPSHGIYFTNATDGAVSDSHVGGNTQDGIRFFNAARGSVTGSRVGIQASANIAQANLRDGIASNGTADNLAIGAVGANNRNFVCANIRDGLRLNSDNNTLMNTYFGNDNIGNGGNGVTITGMNNTLSQASPCTIVDNSGYGVEISGLTNTGNLISRNRFRCNDLGGIEINTANSSAPTPVIITPDVSGVYGTGTPGATIELFQHSVCGVTPCQGWVYIASTIVPAGGTWSVPGPFASTTMVTATQTIAGNNTSEFSACATVDVLLNAGNISLQGALKSDSHHLAWELEGIPAEAAYTIQALVGDEWENIDVVLGATSSTFIPHVKAPSYIYRVMAQWNEETIFSNSVELLSVKSSEASVFPNPAKDHFTIELSGKFQWRIVDAQGKSIQTGMGTDNISLDARALTAGLYYLFISQKGSTHTEKITIL
ncbi:MAG: T9SS type A sorting domain-containing protein [Bacteroidia bacterium]